MKRATRALFLSLLVLPWTLSARAQSPVDASAVQPSTIDSSSETGTSSTNATVGSDAGSVSAAPTAGDEAREPAQVAAPKSAATARNKRPRGPARGRRGVTPAPGTAAAPAAIPNDVPGLKVTSIDIKGNKKIENDAILARLVTKVGDSYTAEKVRQDVDALFKAGYFYDVRVDRRVTGTDAALTYFVLEKPSIGEIKFSGNHELSEDDIKEAAAIKPFEILNMNKLRESTEKIQKLYEDKGYFLARITPRVEPLGAAGESVRVVFDIQENEKVKVKRITFLGNKNIPDGKLKGVMQTQEGGFFSFVSGSGAYKQDAFDRDMQVLQYAYFNEGYVQVKVDRPQVYVTPDKKGIYITIRVEEGDRFKVGTVDFAGDLLFDRDDLFNSIDIDNSGWYVHETLLKDLRTLQAKYGDLGYAYANIIPRTRTRDKDKELDITFEIDKGNKVYFGKINMTGNSRTRDKVIRREMTIKEGELYNETRKRESIDNVKRLGYFDEVNFNSKTPPDNPDLMDLDVVVKERNTGTIQVGAGYSTYSQFIFNGQVNQINLFGRGQKLGISVDLSSNNSLFNLNFTEPHFYDSDWSVGADAYQSSRDVPEYREIKKGGALRLGHPLAPYLNGFVRYKLDNTQIQLTKLGDDSLFPVPNDYNSNPRGNPNGLTSSVTFTLEYDKRNDRFAPTNGVYTSAAIEYAGLGADKYYTKGLFTGRFYKKAFWEVVFRNNLTYGFIHANREGEAPPYNELFLLGGANSLRGYDWYTVGRRRFSQKRFSCLTNTNPVGNRGNPDICGPQAGDPLDPNSDTARNRSLVPYGGTQELFYQAELEFPLITEAGIKGVVFYDIGSADDDLIWNPNDTSASGSILQAAASGFRQDIGFGFRWFSPIGPLRFEWGFPIGRRTEFDERASTFQFAIGSPF